MRIIRDSNKINLPDESIQKFFIQSWYSLVHMNSLDSHRVRCMNAINIVDELMGFIATSKSKLPNINDEIARTAAEALEILADDLIVQQHFGHYWQKIKPLLDDIKPKKSKKPLSAVLTYYLRDFQNELDHKYKKLVVNEIRLEIFNTKDELKLYKLICALLSILIHEGHSIDELFAIIRDIFIANKSQKQFSFTDNFNFMEGITKRDPSDYDIIFKLRGCSKFDHLKSILGEKILQVVEVKNADSSVNN